jgi:hypothetical protein
MDTYQTPNLRCAKGFPIYGCGQPTKKGLHKILNSLEEDGNDVSEINFFCKHDVLSILSGVITGVLA